MLTADLYENQHQVLQFWLKKLPGTERKIGLDFG